MAQMPSAQTSSRQPSLRGTVSGAAVAVVVCGERVADQPLPCRVRLWDYPLGAGNRQMVKLERKSHTAWAHACHHLHSLCRRAAATPKIVHVHVAVRRHHLHSLHRRKAATPQIVHVPVVVRGEATPSTGERVAAEVAMGMLCTTHTPHSERS